MKYDIDDKVTVTKEFLAYGNDGEGQEHEWRIPVGAKGIINSTGMSSRFDFKFMYDIEFAFDDNEVEITIFEEDIDDVCDVQMMERGEGA